MALPLKEKVSLTEDYLAHAIKLCIDFAPRLLLAVITLLLGLWIISKVTKGFKRVATAKEWDPSLIPFVGGIISATLKIVLFISVASLIGIQTTSFVAVLGAASLAIGLALQGSLSNFAGGVLILVLKPYKVGDVIEAVGYSGEVKEIQIFNTILVTGDLKTVILPNGSISNGSIVNFSQRGVRRVDMLIKLSYKDDPEQAKKIIRDILSSYPEVHIVPEPLIEIIELTDHHIQLCVRPFADAVDYGTIQFRFYSDVVKAFRTAGFELPIPQSEKSIG
ncbi:MAG: mechanosensitive ion channel family protein [Cytophagaceae bacterium]|jgi:small conductance mechanosensitive channel|nr:mechanosensitive ion channel family protein [Cytophagaceae bacterium]